jgi:hypothetical protein
VTKLPPGGPATGAGPPGGFRTRRWSGGVRRCTLVG